MNQALGSRQLDVVEVFGEMSQALKTAFEKYFMVERKTRREEHTKFHFQQAGIKLNNNWAICEREQGKYPSLEPQFLSQVLLQARWN